RRLLLTPLEGAGPSAPVGMGARRSIQQAPRDRRACEKIPLPVVLHRPRRRWRMEQQVLLGGEPDAVVEERRAERRAQRTAAAAQQPARLRRPERSQVTCRIAALDDLLPAAHRARAVMAFVDGMDLSALEARIRARGSVPGRPALDPRVGLALWLYATSQGVGSARRLAELCQYHDAYRWLCGGVAVNYHTLSDFRTRAGAVL